MKVARIRRLAVVAAGLACAAGLGTLSLHRGGDVARADSGGTPVAVNAFGCIVQNGGQRTVPAGSAVVIRQGFSEQTLGILQSFLGAEITTVSVDDGRMSDVSEEWGAPFEAGGWVARLDHPTGVTLGTGQSMRFTFALLLKKSVPEVFNPAAGGPAGQPALNAAGLQFGGTCTVTAAS